MRKVGMHAVAAAKDDGDMKKKLAEVRKENKQLRAENKTLQEENDALRAAGMGEDKE